MKSALFVHMKSSTKALEKCPYCEQVYLYTDIKNFNMKEEEIECIYCDNKFMGLRRKDK